MGRKILRPVEASGMQKAQLAMLAQDSHPSPDLSADSEEVKGQRMADGDRRQAGNERLTMM
jgi:hypothetical protein